MNLIYLTLLCGLIATSFVQKSKARQHAESIVGGNVAAVNQNTYAVSIQIKNFHLCGGGILNNRYIITAAHCFINPENNTFENRDYLVVAGVTNAHNKEEQHRVRKEVSKIYIPREYDPIMVPNAQRRRSADIAVLELKSGLGLNQFITNVVLPPNAREYPTYENQKAVVCGYGHNEVTMRHNAQTNEVVEICNGSCYLLRVAQVNILSNMVCRKFFRNIMNSHLCGHMRQRSPGHPEGLCVGDSGSPLVIGRTIIGVVSSSPWGCREDLEPAIYTRVTSFIPFITIAMNGVQAGNMRLAKYEVKTKACGLLCNKKVLVEQ